jgi:maleylacetate reductase
MQPFTYNALPSRVIFGTGTVSQLPQEMKTLGCSNALILTGPHQASEGQLLLKRMGSLAVGVYSNAAMHTPTDVAEDAMGFVRNLGADCVIALGGGSAIGLGKAIALRTDLPQIVLPTTYSGSEVWFAGLLSGTMDTSNRYCFTGYTSSRPDRKRFENDTENTQSPPRSNYL